MATAANLVVNNLNNIFSWPKEKVAQELHPDLLRYFPEHLSRGHINNYYRQVEAYFKVSGMKGEVLDFGCGWGLTSLCMRCLGASKVTGADIVPEKVETAQRLAALVNCDNTNFVLSDDDLKFPDKSFDGILIKDALSHLYEHSPFLPHAARILRKGGKLLIVDDRNAMCPGTVYRTKKLWEWSEAGNPQQLKSLGLTRSFTEERRVFLDEHFPALSPDERQQIAEKYRGYSTAQLANWLRGGELGKPLAKCVGPNGVVQERLINPMKLKAELEEMGFRCKLHPGYREDKKAAIINAGWPLTLLISSMFIMVAERQ